MTNGQRLREYRKQKDVSALELAQEFGRNHASFVTRIEFREIPLSTLAEMIAAIERVVERRAQSTNPADAMQKAGAA